MTFVARKNVPDIPQENHEARIDKLFVELRENAVSDQDSAKDEEGVHEQVAVKEKPSGCTSVFLKKDRDAHRTLKIVIKENTLGM